MKVTKDIDLPEHGYTRSSCRQATHGSGYGHYSKYLIGLLVVLILPLLFMADSRAQAAPAPSAFRTTSEEGGIFTRGSRARSRLGVGRTTSGEGGQRGRMQYALTSSLQPIQCVFLPLLGAVSPGAQAVLPTLNQGSTPSLSCPPIGLNGSVRLLPEYAGTANETPVVRYLVVLDASGSMSANFAGQCNNGGQVVQCANGPPGAPPIGVSGVGADYFWNDETERRIYVAKKALERLVQLTNMPGNTGYTTTRPADQMAVVWFNQGSAPANAMAFSNNPAGIISFITSANATSGDNYRTSGGTNGASGLYRASLLLAAAPKTVISGGKTYTYENRVIFITDGVSNQFLDTSRYDLSGGSSYSLTYAEGNPCRALIDVSENAPCQTTVVGGMFNGWDRPITQMVNVSNTSFHSGVYGLARVSAVALSNISDLGLRSGVASTPGDFFSVVAREYYADGTTNLDKVMEVINTRTVTGVCLPTRSPTWVSTIDSVHLPEGVASLGEVRLTSASTGKSFRISIKRDPTTGQLSYYAPLLPAGAYALQAYVAYKGDDGKTRIYSIIYDAESLVSTLEVNLTGQPQVLDISLRLNGDVCATG